MLHLLTQNVANLWVLAEERKKRRRKKRKKAQPSQPNVVKPSEEREWVGGWVGKGWLGVIEKKVRKNAYFRHNATSEVSW